MSQNSTLWKKTRSAFRKVHLWAGLISGLIVIAVCLSGTIYVYNTEIREFADSERYFIEEGDTKLSLDEIKSKVESDLNGNVTSLFVLDGDDRTIQVGLLKEGEKGRGTTYYVDPYTGDVVGDNSEKTATEEFMGSMFSLHRWLMIDKIEEPILESMGNRELGRLINGITTSLFLFGVITGIVIWVPQKAKSWKQGLKIKWNANWKRVNHDLHNTLAFYSLFILFVMSATGLFWSFEWYREGWQKTWDTYSPPREGAPAGQRGGGPEGEKEQKAEIPVLDFSLDKAVAVANEALPYDGNVRISIPQNGSQDISISKYSTAFFAKAGSDQVSLDQSSLVVKETKLFSDMSTRQQIGRSVKSLHTGEIFGSFTKFLWFLGCLIATSLPITGTLIWLNKKKKKPSRKKAQPTQKVASMA